jgi:hypothetical protein
LIAHRIAVTLIKLGAVFIVVLAARSLADYAFYLSESAPKSLLFGGLVFHLFVPVAIAWMLWRFPNIIVSSLTPEDPGGKAPSWSSEEAMLVGVALIGLYAFVFGIVDLLYFESYRYAEYQIAKLADFPDYPTSPQNFAGRITNIAQILFGLGLIFGRKRIVDLIRKARGARPPASQ